MSIQRSISDSNQQSAPGVGVASLIERLEKVAGGSRALDALIECEVRRFQAYAAGLTDEHRSHWKPVGDKGEVIDDQGFTRYHAPLYSQSVDAAMTLVPHGWCCGFEHAGRFDRNPNSEAWCWPYNSDFEPDWQNGDEGYRSAPDAHRGVGTPAIALCIAALKARTLSESSS